MSFTVEDFVALYESESLATFIAALKLISDRYFGSATIVLVVAQKGRFCGALSTHPEVSNALSNPERVASYPDFLKLYRIRGHGIHLTRINPRSPYGKMLNDHGLKETMAAEHRSVKGRSLLAIHREAQSPKFDEQAMVRLTSLGQHADRVINRIFRLEALRVRQDAFEHLLARHPNPLIIIDYPGKVIYANQSARQACARVLRGPTSKAPRRLNLPAEIRGACQKIQSGKWERPRSIEVCCTGSTSATFRLSYIPTSETSISKGVFMVTASLGGTVEVPELALLTSAEQIVARMACQGLTYETIAKRLNKSVSTVHGQIVSAHRKLGLRGRHALWQLLRGHGNGLE